MPQKDEHIAEVFKAFCDVNRVRILQQLLTGEQCACELQADLGIEQSTLSHHMKTLIASGVVQARKEGRWMYYRLSREGLDAAIAFLEELRKKIDAIPETPRQHPCCS